MLLLCPQAPGASLPVHNQAQRHSSDWKLLLPLLRRPPPRWAPAFALRGRTSPSRDALSSAGGRAVFIAAYCEACEE